jgi:hypothetical protein
MKMGMRGDKDWIAAIAVMLARSDETMQAHFLSVFAKECLSWGQFQAETQLHSVNKHLNEEERNLFVCLGMRGDP